MSAGTDLRDQGMHQVELTFGPAGDSWNVRVRSLFLSLRPGDLIDADSLRAMVGDGDHPNAFGTVFMGAARAGIIEHVGWRQSERTERHGSWIKTWRRLP